VRTVADVDERIPVRHSSFTKGVSESTGCAATNGELDVLPIHSGVRQASRWQLLPVTAAHPGAAKPVHADPTMAHS